MAGQLTLMLGALACAAVLAAGKPSLADGANEEDCRKFHQDCSDARAQGARDAGMCNVERLECTTDPADEPEAGKALLGTMHEQGVALAASGCMTRAILEEIREH